MDRDKIQQIIKEEFENKKVFNANFQFKCFGCFTIIAQGDEFFFVGDKKRVCSSCLGELQEVV